MGSFSIWHWLIVLGVVLLVFGPGRLGNLGRDLGKSIKDFREAMSEKNVTPDKIEDKPTQPPVQNRPRPPPTRPTRIRSRASRKARVMLGHTFLHLPGVGPASEASLWRAGIRSWQDLLAAETLPLGPGRSAMLRHGVEQSMDAMARGDAEWFAPRLRGANAWRLMPHFLGDAGYLDIETDGRSWPTVTAIALYHRGRVRTYVQGREP